MISWFIALHSQGPGSLTNIKTGMSSIEVPLPFWPQRLLTLSPRLRKESWSETWYKHLSAEHIMRLLHPLPPFLPSIFPSHPFPFFYLHISPSLAFLSLSTYVTFINLLLPFPLFFSSFHWPWFGNNGFPSGETRFQLLRVYLIPTLEWKVSHEWCWTGNL